MAIRALIALLAVLLFAHAAAAQTTAFDSKAEEAILVDGRTGAVLYEKNADTLIPPASMSKLMTMVMVFEALKANKLTLDQEFLISENAWRKGGASSGGSTMYAVLNSRIKLRDLMQGVIIQSANDACIAIAEGMEGSEDAFAAKMTARSRELGLKLSTFRNATGLPDPDHRMTARELSMLARYINREFPEHYKIYSQPSFEWNKIKQDNRNPLLKDYPGADGMKTGYTQEAGYGMVGSATRDGRRLIMVVAGLKSTKERKEEAQKLLDWGFRLFKSIDVYAANDRVGQARVWGGAENWVDLVTPNAVRLALTGAEQQSVEVKLHYQGPLLAPVKAGTQVGSVHFSAGGATFAEVPVVTAADVAAEESIWQRAYDSIAYLVFGG
jgi:serine-type D-Ala-D-Ala carboxypeptidase (penicillin-binding protein 5/6)